jgi:hypothetical protein
MKTKTLLTATASSFIILHSAFGQGALTPPGAPAPTMKSLAQIEPRTPISAAPFTITAPGSYYLTTNLTISAGTAINISANNVMLDLNGFTLFSTETPAASSVGISLNSVTNITIIRGCISGGVTNNGGTYGGSGFGSGIYYSGVQPVNARVSGVSVSGCRVNGLFLGTSSMVESCTVNTVGNNGIVAQSVSDSLAQNCGNTAVYAYANANNCFGYNSGSANGVYANTANNCYGTSSTGTGVTASTANNCYGYAGSTSNGLGATIANSCYGQSISGNGISSTVATGCYGETDSGFNNGVLASTANNCTGYSFGSGYGVYAYYVATGCFGSSSTGTGLSAFIASVCHGVGTPALSVTHNVNSF